MEVKNKKMNITEAIEFLKKITTYFVHWNQAGKLKEAVAAVEKAANKQIPKKWEKANDIVYADHKCPTCGNHFDSDTDYWLRTVLSYNYCPHCGQLLEVTYDD